ncbi:MAG TPA: hypothetical protein VF329_00345 [Gammaproteobacteria bacterium]
MIELAEWLQATPVSVAIQSAGWAIPLLQSIHIVMIGVVFVSILMVALRVLGAMRADQPLVDVWRRFGPWMWRGLAVMTVTGALLVVGEPVREFSALSFWMKMGLLAVGVASAAWFGRFVIAEPGVRAGEARPAAGAAGVDEASPATKCAAVATLALWLAIIFLGRAIAYDASVWGTLSPVGG